MLSQRVGASQTDFKGEADKFKIEEGEEEEKNSSLLPSPPPPPSFPFFQVGGRVNVPLSFRWTTSAQLLMEKV